MSWNPDEHYKSAKVAHEYDRKRFSSVAGRVFNHLEQRTIVRCFASLPEGAAIVDAPCGTGRLAEPLLSTGYRVHGVDISDAMLDIARGRLHRFGDRFDTEVCDVKKIGTAVSAKYDGALCARVLMHFPLDQQIEFLSGVAKLSKSVVVINHSLDSPYQRLRRRVKHWLGHQASANFPITDQQIGILLDKSGLREIARHRLISAISEAVYIVAERTAPEASAPR
jgi:2-polyprenyl-3-methyl-5-hydroxy-6-metoxy-1,4-benzoquinol methylase